MAIEIKWKDGETVKTSTISNDKILSTKMVSGKNQPFGAVEATFDRYIFSSEYKDDNWDSTSNPLPNITLGESKMSVDTFGSVTDYIITSVSNDEDYTVVTAHHPAYTLTHTYFNSLFLNIYTVYQTFDNYTKFSVNLPGWSDATFTSDAPNDWYRAQSNKGCSYKYSSTLSGSGHPGSYYETPQKMYNISRYASGVGYYGGKEGYEEVAKKKHTVWYTHRDINLILHISVETVGGKNIRSIEWVEGETEDIVRFIIMMGVSDDVYPQTFSPPMTYYPDFDLDTGLIGADPKKEYTENELNKAMSKGLVNLNQESYASYDFGTSIGSGLSTSRIRLRVNGTSTCKSILDAIGSFTNRKYHFSSEGFFMTNNVPNSDAKQYFVKNGTFGHKKVTINTHKVVYLDMDTSSEYKGVEAEMTSTAPDIIDNTDAVVISSQTVYGENYSWKTSNISSSASKEGSKILFPMVDMSDDNTEGINSYRNRMLGLCAYNELVNRYRYENSIVYTTSEIDAVPKIEGGTPIGDYDEFLRETGQLYVSGDTSTYPTGNYSIGDTILFDDGIVMEKVKKDGAGIRDWVETDLYELSSSYKYSADSCTKLLKDNYNGFELNNVPLAFLIRSYPEHLTTLAWGKSHTNDLPEQLREQQEDIMINGSPGDEDAEISNKYSSRLVVGNLTQSQLAEQDDVKNGFTGLIMEKNVGAELYRLAGYNKGVVQAEFDTEGKIVAGGGSVKLDGKGLTVYTDASGYKETDALTFKDRNGKDLSRIYSTITNGLRHTNIEAYDDMESTIPGIISIYNKHITPEYAKDNTKYTLTSTNTFSGVGGADIDALYGTQYRRISFGGSGGEPITFNLRFNMSEGKFGGMGDNVIDTLVLKIDSAGTSFNIPLNIYTSYYINTTTYNSNNPLWTEQIALNELSIGKYPSIHLKSKNTAIEYIRIRITPNVSWGGNYLTMGPCYITRKIVGGAIELDSEGVSISGNIRLNGSISGSASITGPIVDSIRNLTGNVDVVNYYTYYPVDAPSMFQKNAWIGVFDAGLATGLTTGSAVLVSVVRDHQHMEIWVRASPTSGEMRVAKSTDVKHGDGYSTHTFIVPYGGSFKCSEYPTTISIAELVVK